MIPELTEIFESPWAVLPAGFHRTNLCAVEGRFVSNKRRRNLFNGLVEASRLLRRAGCRRLYLDGSFVTEKPVPNDYDACWDPFGVDNRLMDPVFFDFRNNRAAQKDRFGGEFFPSSLVVKEVGQTFLDFFQIDKYSGKQKGIILVGLANDPMLDTRST